MKLLLSSVCGMAFAAVASAGISVEIDLDGTLGNGPDLVAAEVSDYITADLWITGVGDVDALSINVCNLDGSLEFQGMAYNSPEGWDVPSPTALGNNCYQFFMANIGGEKVAGPIIVPPYMVGTMTWHAAVDNSCDDLSVDLPNSYFIDPGANQFGFDGAIVASVDIGGGCATSVERSAWGSVKSLFR